MAIESERKYIVEPPKSWTDLSHMFDDMIDILHISQTYLEPKGDEPSERVRETISGLGKSNKAIYHLNKKYPIKPGVHEEKEHEISKSEYQKSLKEGRKDKCEVKKTRFVFKYEGQIFELDIFKDHLSGLAILEIELRNIKDEVKLPPFLKVIKEVTNNKDFNNFSLADKRLHKD